MNKWRLLLLAVFCIFQPISTENLFNGRERCLQQRPDFCRKDSRLLEHQSNERTEIRRVDHRDGREFSGREKAEYILRFSERNFHNRDESDRRSRSTDRIRVSRERIAENEYENRLDRRSLRNERSESELRNVREERRLEAEREGRNIRLTRRVIEENRRNSEREDTRRNILSRVDELGRRSLRNERSESELRNVREERRLDTEREGRNIRLTHSHAQENRRNSEREDTRRNILSRVDELGRRSLRNERSESELRNVREERRLDTEREGRNIRLTHSHAQENRRNSEREDTRRNILSRVDELGRRSLRNERSESELRNVREERRLDTEREGRNIRLTRSLRQERRQNEEREDTRRNILSRDSQFVYAPNRRVVERYFEDNEERLIHSRLGRQGRYLNERESRRTSRDSPVQEDARANSEVGYDRLFRTDDSNRRNNERLQREFQRNALGDTRQTKEPESINRVKINSEIRRQRTPAASLRVMEQRASLQRREFDESRTFRSKLRETLNEAIEKIVRLDDSRRQIDRRISPITTRHENERSETSERYNFQRDARNSERADSRFDSQTSRTIRRDIRQNSRVEDARHNNIEISRERVRLLDTSRDSRKEIRAQRSDNIVRDSNGDRRSSYSERNISDRRESVERSDDTRRSRINERLQSQNRRERQNIQSPSVRTSDVETKRKIATLTRNTIEARDTRQKRNLDESRNIRREINTASLDDGSRRDGERLNTRVQEVLQSRRIRDSHIRAINVEQRQDSRRVDPSSRNARFAIGDNKVTARDENASRYSVRDKEMTKERSLERTASMPTRRERDTSRQTRINNSNVLRDTFNQMVREVSQANRENERNVERRVNRQIPQNYRVESRYVKNTFERNMERDSGKRLIASIGERQNSRNVFSRDNRNSVRNVRENKNIREEIRLSLAPNVESSDEVSDLRFQWQHLLYLLQAAYIVGLLTKLPQAKDNFEKKTRTGLWNHSPKLIKVD